MPPKKQARCDGSDSEESDFESQPSSVAAATTVKKAIDAHKKRRNGMRQKIQADYAKKTGEIRKRVQKRFVEYNNKIKDTQQQQLDRLKKAMEVRDSKERAIAEKLAHIYEESLNLVAQLHAVYEGRADDARSASLQKLAVVDKGKGRAG